MYSVVSSNRPASLNRANVLEPTLDIYPDSLKTRKNSCAEVFLGFDLAV